jgi:sec-independent protein translocase protein TatA
MQMTTNMLPTAILAALSTWHIILLVLAVLILFGGKKIPELARGMARGMRIFKDEMHGAKKTMEDAVEEEPPPPAKPAPKQLKQEKETPPPADQAKHREEDKQNLG